MTGIVLLITITAFSRLTQIWHKMASLFWDSTFGNGLKLYQTFYSPIKSNIKLKFKDRPVTKKSMNRMMNLNDLHNMGRSFYQKDWIKKEGGGVPVYTVHISVMSFLIVSLHSLFTKHLTGGLSSFSHLRKVINIILKGNFVYKVYPFFFFCFSCFVQSYWILEMQG